MKTLTNITITILTVLSLQTSVFAAQTHGLNDLSDADERAKRLTAAVKRLAIKDPAILAQLKKELGAHGEVFEGEGHRLGGNPETFKLINKKGEEKKSFAKKLANSLLGLLGLKITRA